MRFVLRKCPLCGNEKVCSNNGEPLISFPVCDSCNTLKVIPARLKDIREVK